MVNRNHGLLRMIRGLVLLDYTNLANYLFTYGKNELLKHFKYGGNDHAEPQTGGTHSALAVCLPSVCILSS